MVSLNPTSRKIARFTSAPMRLTSKTATPPIRLNGGTVQRREAILAPLVPSVPPPGHARICPEIHAVDGGA